MLIRPCYTRLEWCRWLDNQPGKLSFPVRGTSSECTFHETSFICALLNITAQANAVLRVYNAEEDSWQEADVRGLMAIWSNGDSDDAHDGLAITDSTWELVAIIEEIGQTKNR